jgi:predicted negative regulator of RcsB-dependent stress response
MEGRDNMKALIFVVALLLVGVGFYQGWFYFSTNSTNHTSSATITVDQDKLRADEGKAKEKMEEFGQKAKERTGDRTGEVEQHERQP